MVLEAAGAAKVPYTEEVLARFDLVGFDPRGTNASTPLLCFRSIDEALSVVPPLPFPVTSAEEQAFERADRILNAACQRRGGAIADHMATADVARDLDLLRDAVGDRQLTFAGYSYGSFLGMTYANLFPDRVRALVLDGVVDPIAWTTGRGHQARTEPVYNRLGNDFGAQATLDEFFRLCDAAGPGACAFAGDAGRRFAALAARLRAAPLPITDPATGEPIDFTYAHLVKSAWDALELSNQWPDYALFLSELEAAAQPLTAGDAASTPATRPVMRHWSPAPRYPNLVEGNPGVLCSDTDNPDNHRFWVDAEAEADARSGYFGRMWTWFSSMCATWEAADADRYVGPFSRVTANPVMLVGTRFDPASPYENAQAVERLLPASRLLTVDGWGHTSAGVPSQCAVVAVSRYLVDRVVPPRGTTCSADFGPFAAPSAGRTPTARAAPLGAAATGMLRGHL